MTDQKNVGLDITLLRDEIDIGRPVEWMVDPVRRDVVLGMTYAFSESGQRRTVWYTPNKRKAKSFLVVSAPPKG